MCMGVMWKGFWDYLPCAQAPAGSERAIELKNAAAACAVVKR